MRKYIEYDEDIDKKNDYGFYDRKESKDDEVFCSKEGLGYNEDEYGNDNI